MLNTTLYNFNVMATIYKAPGEIPKPSVDYGNESIDLKTGLYPDEVRYQKEVIALAKEFSDCPQAGEVLYYPVGDGKAQYVVLAVEPVALAHLEIGDCWKSDVVKSISSEGVLEKIEQQNALKELFNPPK